MTASTHMRLWRDDRLTNHAQQLAAQYLADLPTRWAHTQAVAQHTQNLAQLLDPAAEHILVSAAWLHDIGYAHQLAHTQFHPLDGAEFAREATFPETVAELVAHHSGAWSEAIERGLTTELARYPAPPTPFLDILTYADLTRGPDGAPITIPKRLLEVLGRYQPGDAVHRAIARSAPSLLAAGERVQARIRQARDAAHEHNHR